MKKFLSILLILAVILGIAAVLVVTNINPILEKLKPKIVAKISEVVKQPVELGKLDVSIFPNPGIEIKDVTIKSASNGETAAKLGTLFLETGLSGLINGKVNVNTLSIQDSLISLKRKKDGVIYLGDFGLNAKKDAPKKDAPKKDAAKENAKASTNTPVKKEDSSASIDFALENLDIEGLNVEWEDMMTIPAAKLNLKDFEISAKNISPKSKGTFSVAGTLLSKASKNFKIDGSISLAEKTAGIPHTDTNLSISSIDLTQVQSLMKSYGVVIENLNLSDNLNVKLKSSTNQNGINVAPVIDASASNIIFGDNFRKASGTTLTIDAKAQPGLLGDLTASKVDINIAGQKISAPLEFSKKTGTKLKLKSASISLAEIIKLLPSLSKHTITGTLAPDLDIVLPKNKKESLIPADINGTLAISKLNVTMPDTSEPIIKSLDTNITFGKNALTLDPLNLFDGSGNLDLTFQGKSSVTSKLNLKNLSIEKISETFMKDSKLALTGLLEKVSATVSLDSKNPQESMKGDAAVALKNVFEGNGNVDVRFLGNSSIRSKLNLKKLSLQKISEAFMKDSKFKFTGALEKVSATVNMNTKNPKESMKGDASVALKNGEILNFNIFKETLGKITNIPGLDAALVSFIPEKYKFLTNTNNTVFDTMSIDTSFANNASNIRSFALKHSAYTIEGSGTATFDGKINLPSRLVIAPEVASEMILKKSELKYLQAADKSIIIPVIIKKNGSIPIVIPDISELVKGAGKAAAIDAGKRVLDKFAPKLDKVAPGLDKVLPGLGESAPGIEKLGDKLGDGIGGALKSLF